MGAEKGGYLMAGHPEDAQIRILTSCYERLDVPANVMCELDLGCGAGSFTTQLAELHPERQIFCADVMLGRLRKVVRKMNRKKLENLTVLRCEARFLLGIMFPDNALDRIHLLCPDPWPKNRHRDHRLLCCDFTTQLHRVLKKQSGVFHFSSDDENYCDAVNRVISASGLFEEAPKEIADVANVKSDFELRWLEMGKPVHHRAWRTLPLPDVTIGH